MSLTRLKTSRARLLAILLAIMTPIGALMSVAAWTNYRFTAASIERDYTLLASNYASRLRVWIRGAERSLAASVAGVRALARSNEQCEAAVNNIVGSVSGYRALALNFADGTGCRFGRDGADISDQRITALRAAGGGLPYTAAGEPMGETLLYFANDSSRDIAIQLTIPAQGTRPAATALLLLNPDLLSATMAVGGTYTGVTMAAVLSDRRVIAVHGENKDAQDWRPEGALNAQPTRWQADGGDGVRRVYASHPVIEPGLYILGGFSTNELNRAWNQFLVLLALPLIVIATLTIAFLRAIDVYVIDWLKQLEFVARERSQMREATVPVSDKMPSEVHSFALAFNDMAAAEASRRTALEKALEENRFLVREMHHRVKNSLQVIQSYLALERREKAGEPKQVLLDAELRVQMLSLGYRTALADGTIDAVKLNEFLPQLLHLISNHVLKSGQVVMLEPPRSTARLALEKLIALGFLLTNTIASAARIEPRFMLRLRLDEDNGDTILTIDADRPMTLPPEPRMNRGLLLQLGADVTPRANALRLAGWRWSSAKAAEEPARFTP